LNLGLDVVLCSHVHLYIVSASAREDKMSALVALGSTGLVVGLALISWALYLLAVALRNSI
jgi:hypothetical protein